MTSRTDIKLNEIKEDYMDIPENNITDFPKSYNHKGIDVNINYANDIYTIYANLCGVERENIHLELTDRTLSIKANRENIGSDGFHNNEIIVGEIMRLIGLEHDVDGEEATSTYKNGLLTIKLPKSKKSKTIKIDVK